MLATEATVLEQFNEEGYAVIRGLLDPEEDLHPVIEEYSELLDDVLERLYKDREIRDTYAGLPFSQRMIRFIGETGSRYYNNFQIRLPYEVVSDDTPFHLGPAIFSMLRSPRLLDGIETFIGPEISCNPVNVVRLKPPERVLSDTSHAGIARVPWHQDLVNYPKEAAETSLLTVWVPLSSAATENGCLLVIPGSHMEDLEVHCPADINDPVQRKIAGGGIPDELIDPARAVPVPVEPGDVIFMHRLTKHSALSNTSDDLRFSFDLRYHPTHQFSGQPLKPSWVARSRAHPKTEVREYREWAQMWYETRDYLANTKEIPAYLRYSLESPICDPRETYQVAQSTSP